MEKREHEDSAHANAAKKARAKDEAKSIASATPVLPAAAGSGKEEKRQEKDEKGELPVNPFEKLKIASHEYLKALDGSGRSECAHCHLKRNLHWPGESLSKSTAVHAKILAPDFVSFHEYPSLPVLSPVDSLLLYPSKTAQPIEKIDMSKIKHVVFIDSQWQQANKILRDPLVQSLPHVKIESQKTNFWRYQQLGDEALATVEAIYYFYREYQMKITGKYQGEYDNLLFFYAFMYNLIQERYKKDKSITFTHKKEYIKYE